MVGPYILIVEFKDLSNFCFSVGRKRVVPKARRVLDAAESILEGASLR